ncbi:MAG: hypothetical protein K2N44_02600 [Lachnospiraceae bacterium]|nr:hypothetical protein [Lachnospiraceae bacterium]
MSDDRIKKTGEACFWLGLLIELFIVIIDKSAYINPLESQLFRLTFLLFCIKIALTKYSTKEWMCVLLFGTIMFVSYLINEKDETVRVIAFIAACKGMNIKKVMKVVFWVTLTGCAVLVVLSLTGVYGTITLTADFGRGGQLLETRYILGMGHPNALHCMIWMLIVLGVYSYADVLKWYHFTVFMAMDFVLFFLTDSKTGVIAWAFFVALAFVMQYNKKCRENKSIYILGTVIVLGCVVFAMIGSHVENTYFTPDSLMHKLDKVLNGRYQSCYAVEAARLENWKLFAAPENTEYFDAGFVRLFYWYGIVPGIIYIGMNIYLLYQSYREKDYVMFTMLVAFSIFNLMEAHFISVYILRNYLLVLMGYYWYRPFEKKPAFEGYFWQVKGLLGKA